MKTIGSSSTVWVFIAISCFPYFVIEAIATLNSVATRAHGVGKTRLSSRIRTIFPPPSNAIATTSTSTTTTTKFDEKTNKKNKDYVPASLRSFLPFSNKAAVEMGMILAFNSGVINCCCLSGLLAEGIKQGTAGITGTWTNSAIGAASMLYSSSSSSAGATAANQFILNAKFIFSYIAGSLISGLILPRPKLFELHVKKILSIFVMAFGILTGASILANTSNINYLFLCCLANGIQNSLTSVLTANVCRTSHFTGITSDIGTFLGQILRGNMQNLSRLKSISLLALSFWVGGFVSFGLIQNYGCLVLFGSALIHLALAMYIGFKAFRIPVGNK